MQRAVSVAFAGFSILAALAFTTPADANCGPGMPCPHVGPGGAGPGPGFGPPRGPGSGPRGPGFGPRGPGFARGPGGGDVGAAIAGGLIGGILGAAMDNAAAAPPPDMAPCAAYQAIVNEDIAAGVRPSLYRSDYARLQECLER